MPIRSDMSCFTCPSNLFILRELVYVNNQKVIVPSLQTYLFGTFQIEIIYNFISKNLLVLYDSNTQNGVSKGGYVFVSSKRLSLWTRIERIELSKVHSSLR